MDKRRIGKPTVILLMIGFGVLFYSLFSFRDNPTDVMKRGLFFIAGMVLIFLYLRFFISVVKVYFLKTTEQLYSAFPGARRRMSLFWFRVAAAVAVPLALVLLAWLAGSQA